ncbi:transmembrane protein, putative (macronuclear) [Tetrahymena thermophila SB210]|uniref:Transmembrane protein, putative n=1 Tax=Tetrahymena thermophila (strain SB210) TaxID=312017 RepID=Q22MU5_TETTS|nr:transmembrane protein, putative [Tetrahymena thermophila SB210]EAR86389.1 transmembrane protein, putative [Tetrahymena thermophila SB210]|eukprot:XP_976925.1 transmembrane protein, putative [Tetrahymena thermophila SB210]
MNNLLSNKQYGNGFSLLRKVDMFGVPIQINFNYENKHTTKFGGIMSLAIVALLLTLLINLLISIINKSNPQVLQEQLIVENPSRYDLNNQNFNFAITLLDENYSPFIDESYYTITANFLYKQNQTLANGTIIQQFQSKNIDLVSCNPSSFQVQGTSQFFMSQDYNNLYCIKDINQLYIVGQFDQPDFSVIQYFVSQCSGVNCQNQTEIQRKLSVSQLQIYYSNYAVRLSNLSEPFQPLGQSLFWQTSLKSAQVIDITYMNTYVTDDLGLISNNYVTQSKLLYSNNRVTFSSSATSYFYQLSIFMEKNKEMQYRRSYMKLTQAISQVGGIYNVLFLIGCLIAQPYSYLELQRKIVNSTFSFSSQYLNQDNKQKKKDSKNKKDKGKQQKGTDKQKVNGTQKEQEGQESNRTTNNNQQNNLNETFQNKDYIIEDNQQRNSNTERPVLDKSKNSDQMSRLEVQKSNIISTAYTEFKVRSVEYFKYYLQCFKCFKSDIQLILSFGTKKIYEFTDICYIVNKLIEVEKIKHLILNDQQLKLFEYVPKPKITKSIIDGYRQAKQNERLLYKAIKSKQTVQLDQLDSKLRRDSANQQLNILTIMNRSQLDKAREAQRAYNYIYKNQKKLSKIDKKLLLLLDEQHIPLFDSNSFDSSMIGKYNNNILQQNNQQSESLGSPQQTNKNFIPDYTLDQSQILKKSVYYVEQKSKNQEIMDEIQKEEQEQQTQNHNKITDKTTNAAIPIEDISMSCHSHINNDPYQMSVIGASPALQINDDDIPFHFRNISSNDICQQNQNE